MSAITFQWKIRESWPRRSGMIFFACAVEHVGQAISADRSKAPESPSATRHTPWHNDQLIGNPVHYELPIDPTRASYDEQLVAKELLADYAPEQCEPVFLPATDGLPARYELPR
jgi:hypothetical protein